MDEDEILKSMLGQGAHTRARFTCENSANVVAWLCTNGRAVFTSDLIGIHAAILSGHCAGFECVIPGPVRFCLLCGMFGGNLAQVPACVRGGVRFHWLLTRTDYKFRLGRCLCLQHCGTPWQALGTLQSTWLRLYGREFVVDNGNFRCNFVMLIARIRFVSAYVTRNCFLTMTYTPEINELAAQCARDWNFVLGARRPGN